MYVETCKIDTVEDFRLTRQLELVPSPLFCFIFDGDIIYVIFKNPQLDNEDDFRFVITLTSNK